MKTKANPLVEPNLMEQIFDPTQTSIVINAGLRKKKLAVLVDKQPIPYNFAFFTLENTNSFRTKIISDSALFFPKSVSEGR